MKKRVNTAQWMDNQNRWQIKVQKNGIRKAFYSTTPGRAGQRECNAKADLWLDDGIINTRIKVKDMTKLYMEELKDTTGQSHWRQYDNYIRNYINKYIGSVPMEDLNEQHFQTVINKAFSKGLAKKTLENIRACEMNFLKFCRKSKKTTLFCEGLRIPKGAEKGERTILQPDDLIKLMTENTTLDHKKVVFERYIYAYRFQVLTGLRPGEIIGLQRKDIKNGIVFLKRSINYYGETTKGKNENAARHFKLHPLAAQILEEQLKMTASEGIISPYVFCSSDGYAAKEQTYCKHLKTFCKVHDIPEVTPYELRHTFVSIAKTVDTGLLKDILGHSADMDTLGTYSHEVDGDMQRAAEQVENAFSRIFDTKTATEK